MGKSVASLEVGGTRFLAWEEARERDLVAPPTTIGRLLVGLAVPFSYLDSRENSIAEPMPSA